MDFYVLDALINSGYQTNKLKRRNTFLSLSTLENELLKMNAGFLSTLNFEEKKDLHKQNKRHIKIH